jgi:hypothetical protein
MGILVRSGAGVVEMVYVYGNDLIELHFENCLFAMILREVVERNFTLEPMDEDSREDMDWGGQNGDSDNDLAVGDSEEERYGDINEFRNLEI